MAKPIYVGDWGLGAPEETSFWFQHRNEFLVELVGTPAWHAARCRPSERSTSSNTSRTRWAFSSPRAATSGLAVASTSPVTCVLTAILAMVSWMAALTKFQLTYAYPFVSTTFALVLILSAVFFGESITPASAAGVALIVVGRPGRKGLKTR